jgi:uncharacterized peroxidase-related enzyme
MARVRNIEADELEPAAKAVYERYAREYGPFLNQVRVFAHRPPALIHIMGLLLDFADEAVLNKRHLEIALVTVSTLNACRYCVAHHAPRAIEHGLSAEAMEQILSESVPSFDAVDHLVRDYAVAVTNEWNSVRDDMFNRLREHFTEEQIVELTLRISLCGFFNRFNDVLQIDMEQGVLQDLLASGASENMLPASHN